MKVKRYFAQDMRSALAMVREAQGPDVVILSNRAVEGGVELITSAEPQESAASAQPDVAVQPEHGKSVPPRKQQSETLWTREPIIEQMQDEMKSLRRLVETQLAGLAWGDQVRRDPLRADMQRRLVGIGISTVVAEQVVSALPSSTDARRAWRHTLAILGKALPIAREDSISSGVFAFVGPTGVGKSTLLAKVAARHALHHGPESLALITTDDKRLGAHEQLRSFGRILGVPVWTAANAEEFGRALDAGATRRLLLVDTPGGLSESDASGLCETLSPGLAQMRVLMVIDAVAQTRAVQRAIKALAPLHPQGCCISKLDETTSLGPALSCIIESELPVHLLSTGQGIPDDLETAQAHRLVARAVALHQGAVMDCDEALVRSAFEESTYAYG